MTKFGKTSIVHRYNFAHSKVHKTIGNTCLIWISNVLKIAHNIFDHPRYGVLGCPSATSLKFCLQNAQNPVKIVLHTKARAVPVHSACIIKPSCVRNFSAGRVIFFVKTTPSCRKFCVAFRNSTNTFNLSKET